MAALRLVFLCLSHTGLSFILQSPYHDSTRKPVLNKPYDFCGREAPCLLTYDSKNAVNVLCNSVTGDRAPAFSAEVPFKAKS